MIESISHCVSRNESVQYQCQTHSMELKTKHQNYYAMSTRVDDDDTGQ